MSDTASNNTTTPPNEQQQQNISPPIAQHFPAQSHLNNHPPNVSLPASAVAAAASAVSNVVLSSSSSSSSPSSSTFVRALPRPASLMSVQDDADDDRIPASIDARTKTNATEVQLAYGRVRLFLKPTPLYRAAKNLVPGAKSLWIKAEQTQPTGSFKVRGACNALLLLSEEERKRGVTSASAGNHSQALSLFAKRLGIPVTVYMPTIAPLTKVQSCISLGAEVIITGDNLNVSREVAMAAAEEAGTTYIHGFNDPAIVNGAGSCGIEIMEQLPDVEVIVVAAGGAGLIAGVAVAAKQRNPNVKIISVESSTCPSMIAAHKAGKPVKVDAKPTLADGTAVPVVGDHAFAVADPLIDEFIVVEEKWICLALVRVLEVEKVVLEGSGALGIAAFLSGQLDHLKAKKCCCIFTGGNIDITVLGRVIDRGLFVDYRLLRIRANISDNPGALVEFLNCIAEVGASVKDIQQERGYIQSRAVWVRVSVETRGRDHADEMLQLLRAKEYHIEVENDTEVSSTPPQPPPQPKKKTSLNTTASPTPSASHIDVLAKK